MDDKKANKAIEKTYDLLHSSPAKSNPSVHSLEREILSLTHELESAVYDKNVDSVMRIIADINANVEERNRRLRIS